MNDGLRQMIGQLRSALSELDDGPRIGEIPPGNRNADCEIESWREFLVECDGGRFGDIDIWSSDELPSYQETPLPVENASSYLVIGQILYEPIVIDRNTAILLWLPMNASTVTLGTVDHFVRHFIFGSGYADVVPEPEKDPWWQFLLGQFGRKNGGTWGNS